MDKSAIKITSDKAPNLQLALKKGEFQNYVCLHHSIHNLIIHDALNNVAELIDLVKKLKKIFNILNRRRNSYKNQHIYLINMLDSIYDLLDNEDFEPINQLIEHQIAYGGLRIHNEINIRWNSLSVMIQSFIFNFPIINKATTFIFSSLFL